MTAATLLIPGLDEVVRGDDPKRRADAAQRIVDLFLQGDVPAETKERLEYYLKQAHKQTLPVYWTADDRDRHPTRALCHLVLTLPEFQLN